MLAVLALEAGLPVVAEEAHALAERLAAGRFYVVCVGQFKRGKSTLLNALLGAPILPTGVVPVTSVVTIVRHGESPGARVRFRDRGWEDCDAAALETYVSEEHNPGNEKGVLAVEVFVPSALLQAGLCLVDTPGLGSVVLANAEATRAFVPHVDAALLVLGGDPPITAEERALAQVMAPSVPDVIVVFNKADRQADAERAEAAHFTGRVLEEALGRHPGPILHVSARERLAGSGPARDWPRLVERLTTLARESGAGLVVAARDRETAALIDRLRGGLDEQHGALLRPIEDSERRVVALHAAVEDAGRALIDLGHLLDAEQERLARRFGDARDRAFDGALLAVQAELRRALDTEHPGRDRALELARAGTQRWLDGWRREQEPHAEAFYAEAERRFVELANGVRRRLTAVSGFESLPPLRASPGFRVKSGFYYAELRPVAPASAATWLLDRILSWRRRRAIERAALEYQRRLLEVNSARITNDFIERVTESRRRLERELRDALHSLVASADRALGIARQAKADGAAAVTTRLEAIEALRRRLDALGPRCQEEEPGSLPA